MTLATLLCFLLVFGFIENSLNLYSFIVAFLVLLFFIILILINQNMQLGGGDIKYMVLIAIFLSPLQFAYFFIITGVVQTLLLLYVQIMTEKKQAPMVPAMFLAVVVTVILFKMDILPM